MKNAAWVFLERGLPPLAQIVFSILIARILGPEPYGTFVVLLIAVAVATALQDLGLTAALVQRDALEDIHLQTAFSANLILGIVCVLAFVAMAFLLPLSFDDAVLYSVFLLSSPVPLLRSLATVQAALLMRNFRYRAGAIVSVFSIFIGLVIGYAMARGGAGVYSLVAMLVAQNLVRSVLLWALVKWIPKSIGNTKAFFELWRYSKNLFLSSLFHQVSHNFQSVLIARFYNPLELGVFSRGQSLSQIPNTIITGMIQRIAFPVYSRKQAEPLSLARLLGDHTQLTSFGASLAAIFIFISAPSLVDFLLGEDWAGAVLYLRIICLSIIFNSLYPVHLELIKAVGDTKLFLKLEISKKVIRIFIILLGSFYGIVGMAWSLVIASSVDYFLTSYFSNRSIGRSFLGELVDLRFAALSVIVLFFMYFIDYSLTVGGSVQSLLLSAVVTTGTGLGAIIAFRLDVLRKVQRSLSVEPSPPIDK